MTTPEHLALWRMRPYHNLQVQLRWRGHLTTFNATCRLRKFCDKRTMRNKKALYHRSAVAMVLCSHMPGCLSMCPSDAVRTGYPASFAFSPRYLSLMEEALGNNTKQTGCQGSSCPSKQHYHFSGI